MLNFVSFGFTPRSLFYAHFYTRVLQLDLTQIGGFLFGSMLNFGPFGFTLGPKDWANSKWNIPIG
jgi:hypothetical protein